MRAFLLSLVFAFSAAHAQDSGYDRLQRALSMQDSWERMAAVAEVILAMEVDHIEETAERMLALPLDARNQESFSLLWKRLGALKGADAVESALSLSSDRQRRTAWRASLEGWTRHSPESAWRWALGRSQAGIRPFEGTATDLELRTAGEVLLKEGRSDLVFELYNNPAVSALTLSLLTRSVGRYATAEALRFAEDLPAGGERTALLESIALTRAELDPAGAAAWARTLDSSARTQVVGSVLRFWAGEFENPAYPGRGQNEAIVAGWMLAQPPGRDIDGTLRQLGLQSGLDPEVREQLLKRISDPGDRDAVFLAQISRLLPDDPSEAALWAALMHDAAERAGQLGRVIYEWEKRDPDAAWNFIQSSPSLTAEERRWLGRNLQLQR